MVVQNRDQEGVVPPPINQVPGPGQEARRFQAAPPRIEPDHQQEIPEGDDAIVLTEIRALRSDVAVLKRKIEVLQLHVKIGSVALFGIYGAIIGAFTGVLVQKAMGK